MCAGDRVVVQLPNTVDFLATTLALFRLGALPVFALPAHRKAEVAYLCEHTEAVALVVPAVGNAFDHRPMAAEVQASVPTLRMVIVAGDPGGHVALASVDADAELFNPRDPSDVAFFLLSGGTTGMPKLIPRTHDDYAYQMRATAEALGFDHSGVYLAALPVAHNAALGCPGALGTLRVGGRVILASSPSPDEVFPLVQQEGVTLTTLMPAFVPLWMEAREWFDVDLSGLTIEVGGARLDPELARQVTPVLGCTLTHWYGMAEGLLSFTRPGDPDEIVATTQGRPLCPDDELRVVDELGADVPPGEVGELLTSGPYTLRGYYRAEAHNATAFTPDGFFHTGDLVRMTPEGRVVVEGRLKDTVNRGGEKVAAEEVEAHLIAHPSVSAAALVAVPDPYLGEKTCAFVVPAGTPPSLADLKDFLAARGLADFKFPDRLELVASLPRTSLGKIDKRALRQAATGGPDSKVGAPSL